MTITPPVSLGCCGKALRMKEWNREPRVHFMTPQVSLVTNKTLPPDHTETHRAGPKEGDSCLYGK